MTPETILVVEDDAAILDILQEMLETAGFRVATGRNGLEGLAVLETTRPHLVLSDISMPKMDG
ncbi:MAG TPA: response regulator, partial [Vicinamibacteria bacterium]